MDPNAALARIRQLVDTQLQQGLSTELADTFRGLDEWLVRGGFLPSAWQARDYSYAAAHHVEPLGPPNPAGAELPEVTHDDVIAAAKKLNEQTFAKIRAREAGGIVSVDTNGDGDYVIGIREDPDA